MSEALRKVGQAIREVREAKHVTQHDLGAAAGLSRGSIANIERGEQNLTVESLLRIAQALGTTPGYLVQPAGARLEPSDLPLLVAQGTVPLEGARDIVYRILLISNEVSGSFEGPEHRPDLIVEVRTLDGLGNPTWIKATNDYLPAVVAHALAGHASERAVFWKLECGLRNAAT